MHFFQFFPSARAAGARGISFRGRERESDASALKFSNGRWKNTNTEETINKNNKQNYRQREPTYFKGKIYKEIKNENIKGHLKGKFKKEMLKGSLKGKLKKDIKNRHFKGKP